MATVGASLKLFDNFSKVMNQTQISMEATLSFAKRLRKEFQKRIVLDVNVTGAIKQLEQVKKLILKLDGPKNGVDIRVSVDIARFLKQVSGLKAQIKDRIGTITTQLNLILPGTLEKLIKDLSKLMKGSALSSAAIRSPAPINPGESSSAKTSKVSNQSSSGGGALKMLGGIKNFASGILDKFGGAKQIISSTIGGAMEQQNTKDSLGLLSGSDVKGTAIFDQVSKQALKFGQNIDDAMSNTKSFMPETTDPKQLADLNKLTMRLANLNPEEGTKGATSAIKSFMNGDSKDLVEKFNMKDSTVKGSSAMKAGNAGDMQGFIKGMDTLLNKSGVTEQALENMADKPAIQWQKAVGYFQNRLADAGLEAMNALGPLGNMINDAFKSGKLQPFFDMLSIGLTWMVDLLLMVVQGARWLGDVFMAVLPYVGPLIFGIAGALLIYYGILMALAAFQAVYNGIMTAYKFVTLLAASAQSGLNLVMLANPFVWVTALVLGLILVFLGLIATLKPVREFVAETFRVMGTVIAGVLGFIIDIMTTFINNFIDKLNFFLSGINKVSGVLGALFGFEGSIDLQIGHLDTSGFKDSVQNGIKGAANAVADVTGNFSMENIKAKIGFDKLGKTPTDPPPSKNDPNAKTNAFGKDSTINKVNEVGKIGETVDISSEDLKVMSDLAEMKSIQNFVTLTPTVQVTTGDIHEKADINEIIRGIEETLAGSISTSAQGVYQ